jgi:hypothetical protein
MTTAANALCNHFLVFVIAHFLSFHSVRRRESRHLTDQYRIRRLFEQSSYLPLFQWRNWRFAAMRPMMRPGDSTGGQGSAK